MHTVSVMAIHNSGEVVRIWEESYPSFLEAQTRGVREAQEFLLSDAEWASRVSVYQVLIPAPTESGYYSRFFTMKRDITEVVF